MIRILGRGSTRAARYRTIRDQATGVVQSIDDEFIRAAAVHHLAVLCKKANDLDHVRPLFDKITDDFVRRQILADCPELETVRA